MTELIGAEQILAGRGKTPQAAGEILATIGAIEKRLSAATASTELKHRSALISPGNEDGGVTTVAEKALGGIYKARTGPISGVVAYGQYPEGPGPISWTASVTTEKRSRVWSPGLPGGRFHDGPRTTGFPGVPVIKITGNTATFERMKFNLDFNAGPIMEGATIAEVGGELFEKILRVASGEPPRAELLGHDELFCITRI